MGHNYTIGARQPRLPIFEVDRTKNGKRTQGGETTSDLVVSAHIGTNDELFPHILELHVPKGALVADVTFGKGVFWRKVPQENYAVIASDIATGIDCQRLPYKSESFDCVVLDPPYMEGFYRQAGEKAAGGTYNAFRDHYSNGNEESRSPGPKWQEAVLHFYVEAGKEAHRVLKEGGVLIVKCQDAVSANRQYLTHIQIVVAYEKIGFYAKDLFVLIRRNRPAVSRIKKQVHARKNHSYFLVFLKAPEGKVIETMKSS
jgi:hypothetical protein